MLKHLNQNARLTFGRDLDPGELEQRALVSAPEQRVEIIKQFQKELDRDDLSFNERASLLDTKCRLGALHERMLKVYR